VKKKFGLKKRRDGAEKKYRKNQGEKESKVTRRVKKLNRQGGHVPLRIGTLMSRTYHRGTWETEKSNAKRMGSRDRWGAHMEKYGRLVSNVCRACLARG